MATGINFDFIEKKRDKDGNLTHVLCAIRSISDVKKKRTGTATAGCGSQERCSA